MRLAYHQKIGTRLGFGFAIVISLTVLLGIIALVEMRSQANLTRDLYNHPLVVSNAIRDIRGNILAMQRSMRDFILTDTDTQRQETINHTELEEQKTLQAFDILYDRFFGDKADVDAARKAFMDWKVIRIEVIDMVQNGKKDEAAQVVRSKSAEQVLHISNCIQVVSDFAKQKATAFFNQAQKTEQQHFWFMSGLVLLISAAGVTGGVLITRSITGPLGYVAEQIMRVATGDLDHKIDLNSDDEIGLLARTFDKMTASLNKITASRNELDAANQQLGAANQQLRAHEQQLRAANQQLRASEQHRESIVSTVPGVVYCLQMDADGAFSISYISQQAESIIGHPLSILTNSDCFFDIIHSEDADCFRSSILDSARTLESCTVEFRVFDTNGRLRWLKSISTPRRFDDNNIVWNGIIVDITDRKQDEARLLESEECYRIVADNTYSWEFWMAPDDRYAYISPSCRRITGYTAEEFKIDSGLLKAIIHPDDRQNYQAHSIEIKIKKLAKSLEFRIIHKDGQVHWIEQICQPVFDKDGKWLGIRGSNRDATERKQGEKALQQSEERFRLLFEQAPLGYQSLDEEGHFIEVNQAWLDMLGYSRHEVVGKWFGDFLAPEFVDAFRERFPIFKAAGKIHAEFQMLHKSGQRRFIAFEGRIGHKQDGAFKQTHCILADITERKRAEEVTHRLNRELRAVSNCNQILVRAQDEQALLDDICRIICSEAGYRMAWVGYAEQDEAKTVRPVAWAGVEDDHLVNANITWADTERGRGPTGTAIRSGKSVCIHDFTTDPQAAPWRENALRIGYRSSIALPLKDENANIFGTLNIYSVEPNAFTPDEIRLLEELSGDLAFGVTVLRTRIERERAEEALFEHEQRLRSIVEGTSDAIYIKDLKGRYLLFNTAASLITGKSPAEVLGKDDTFLFPEDQAKVVMEGDRKVMEGRRVMAYEENVSDSKGESRFFNSVKGPLLDEYNNVTGLFGVAHDITERKRAEEALKESVAKFRSLFDAMSEGVALHELITDKDGKPVDYRIIDVNPAYEKHTGLIAAKARNQLASVLYRADCPPYLDLFAEVAQTGKPLFFETFFPPLKKSFDISVFSPKLGWFATVFTDVTQRIQAQQELRRNEEKFMKAFRNSPAIMTISTIEEGRLIEVNDMFVKTLGYERQEVIGKTSLELNLYADYGQRSAIVQSVKDHGDVQNMECMIRARSGQLHCGLISAEIIEFQDAMYLLTSMNDITDRKKAEEVLQLHQANMAHLLRLGELGEMTSGLAHEINQPLCAIENYAQASLRLMETNPDPIRLADIIKDIRTQAERAGKIIHRVRGLVRKKAPHFEYGGIKDVIQEAIDLINVEAKKQEIQIHVHVPENLSPVCADFILIEQVILNLIRNGLDAMDNPQISKKELTIRAEAASNSMIEVCISDTGCGISKEDMGNIFESFFTTKPDGLGIGLPLCRAIIESHSGQIWATANTDGGTTFHFTLSTRSHTDET